MKLKDFFTLGNLLSGYAAVIALLLGSFDWAVALIFIGYGFDLLDGPVARLTKQHDSFGSIFDSVCDYITNSIAPSYILFYAFWKNAGFHWFWAAVIGAFPVAFGTIRQAKQQDVPRHYPCYWLGVPRPVLAIFILALLNSSVFTIGASPWKEVGWAVAIVLIVTLSILHLSTIPFCNHHDGRRWMKALWFGRLFFLAGSPLSLVWGWLLVGTPAVFFDWVLFSLIVYIFVSWLASPKEDFRRIRHYVKTGELKLPLVHPSKTWRPRTWFPYILEDDEETRRQ